jgi:type III secretion protein W
MVLPPRPVSPAEKADKVRSQQSSVDSAEAPVTVEDELSGQALAGRLRGTKERRTGAGLGLLNERVLADEAEGKVQRLKQRVLQEANHWEEVLAWTQSMFEDISDQVAVVRWLLDSPELEERHRELLRKVEQVLRQRSEHAGKSQSLKAGLNTVTLTRLTAHAQGLDAPQLRKCYRHFLAAEEHPLTRYEEWISMFGFDKRMEILTYVETAVTIDMCALDPSCSNLEFGDVLARIGELRRLRAIDTAVCGNCLPEDIMKRIGWDRTATLIRTLKVVRDGQGTQDLLRDLAMSALGLLTQTELLRLVHGYRRAWRFLPEHLWPSPRALLQANDEMDVLVAHLSQSEAGASQKVFESV